MNRKTLFILLICALFLGSCAVWQSMVKSTFPYTTTLYIPRSSAVGVDLQVTGMASSFDQDIQKEGNSADKVKDVRMASAKIKSDDPSDFNIGNLTMVKVYMSKADSTNEVLVASRTDLTPGVGSSVVLDIDNSNVLDALVKEPKLRIRMVYRLRNHIDVNAHLKLVLGVDASPKNN